MSTLWVVAYDIPCDRRRNRVAKVLEGYGQRVQDSVFECWLDKRHLAVLKTKLARRIDPQEDKIRYYPLCGKDDEDLIVLGCGTRTEDDDFGVV